ncbi:MAG: transposase family protein, partial [Chloroflexota bacterium]|nr:transposase family protein [Chloroflexota bacterium]
MTAGYQGEYGEARRLHLASLEIWKGLGSRRRMALALHNLGDVANASGAYQGLLIIGGGCETRRMDSGGMGTGLLAAFATVPDPRSAHGRRH